MSSTPHKRTLVISYLAAIVVGGFAGAWYHQANAQKEDHSHGIQTSAISTEQGPNQDAQHRPRSSRRSPSTDTAAWRTKLKILIRLSKGRDGNGLDVDSFGLVMLAREAARSMSEKNLKLAILELYKNNQTQDEYGLIFKELINQLGRLAPVAAIKLIRENNEHKGISTHVLPILGQWFGTSSSQAEHWYLENKDTLSEMTQGVMDRIIETRSFRLLVKEDFPAAINRASTAPDEQQKRFYVSLWLESTGDDDKRNAILSHLQSLDNKHFANQIAAKMTFDISLQDIMQAREFVENWPGKNKRNLVNIAVSQWMKNEPAKAMEWSAKQLESDPTREITLAGLITRWRNTEPAAAEQWLSTREPSEQDSIRSNSYDRFLYTGQHSEAAKWIEKINNQSQRTQAYQQIYSQWTKAAPKEAEKWFSHLPEADQAAIKNSPQSRLSP